MAELMTIHNEWKSRPADERIAGPTPLYTARDIANRRRLESDQAIVQMRDLTAAPVEGNDDALAIISPSGVPMLPTNWAFNQIARAAGCPGSFLSTLPSDLAADVLNHRLAQVPAEQRAQIYRGKHAGATALRAVTGPDYGRIYNSQILAALADQVGDGFTGRWRVPGIRGTKLKEVTKENTTIFMSDRDLVLCLADEDNRIEMKGRRDGKPGSLARGVIIGNSEVGAGVFWITGFLFDFVCANRIIWGAEEVKEIRVRHTSGAPDRWMADLMPQIKAYSDASTRTIEVKVKAAQSKMLGPKEEIDGFMGKWFTGPQVDKVHVAHGLAEHREILSLWDVVTGATEYAKTIEYQDQRLVVEKAAGEIMALV